MNAPLTPAETKQLHTLQCKARSLGLTLELHFTLAWQVVILLDGREFTSIAEAAESLECSA